MGGGRLSPPAASPASPRRRRPSGRPPALPSSQQRWLGGPRLPSAETLAPAPWETRWRSFLLRSVRCHARHQEGGCGDSPQHHGQASVSSASGTNWRGAVGVLARCLTATEARLFVGVCPAGSHSSVHRCRALFLDCCDGKHPPIEATSIEPPHASPPWPL